MPSQPVRLHQGKSSERCSWHASKCKVHKLHHRYIFMIYVVFTCIPGVTVGSVLFVWGLINSLVCWFTITTCSLKCLIPVIMKFCHWISTQNDNAQWIYNLLFTVAEKITQVLQWVADRLTQTVIFMQVPVWVQSLVTSVSTPPPPSPTTTQFTLVQQCHQRGRNVGSRCVAQSKTHSQISQALLQSRFSCSQDNFATWSLACK